jgi:hypothetical protein
MPFNVSCVAVAEAVVVIVLVAVAVFNALKLKCSRSVSNATGHKPGD